MHVTKEELPIFFSIMDEDESGHVDYTEFANMLYRMRSMDQRSALLLVKHHVTEVRKELQKVLTIHQIKPSKYSPGQDLDSQLAEDEDSSEDPPSKASGNMMPANVLLLDPQCPKAED